MVEFTYLSYAIFYDKPLGVPRRVRCGAWFGGYPLYPYRPILRENSVYLTPEPTHTARQEIRAKTYSYKVFFGELLIIYVYSSVDTKLTLALGEKQKI